MSTTTVPKRTASTGRRSRLVTLIAVAITIVGILAVAWYVDQPTTSGVNGVALTGDTSGPAPQVGELAPDFAVTTTDGRSLRLSDLRGQPVWLSFGASWCGDCRAEAPDLEATYQALKDKGLQVVFISISEDARGVRDYAARAGLTYTQAADPDTLVASRYHILGIPTHYFIAPDGTIKAMRIGGLPPQEMQQLAGSVLD